MLSTRTRLCLRGNRIDEYYGICLIHSAHWHFAHECIDETTVHHYSRIEMLRCLSLTRSIILLADFSMIFPFCPVQIKKQTDKQKKIKKDQSEPTNIEDFGRAITTTLSITKTATKSTFVLIFFVLFFTTMFKLFFKFANCLNCVWII